MLRAGTTLLASALLLAGHVRGAVSYVDATSGAAGNTALADAALFSPPLNGTTGADNNWEQRTVYGSGGNIFEAGGETAENAPELKTRLSGLAPGAAYKIYAYFWDATGTAESWSIRAGFSPGAGTNALYAPADISASLGATSAVLASGLAHATNAAPTVFVEGNRTLYAALVGTASADTNGAVAVYIDDRPSGIGANARTWYDGLGYALVDPSADDDGDGLTNAQEAALGTNPDLADTDGDTYSDGAEVAAGSNPLVASSVPPLDPAADDDGDGLTNGQEATYGTNPKLADTDGDAFSDGAEVAAGTDPLDAGSAPFPGGAKLVAPDGAWTWFNDERAIFHQGSLFSGYVKANGQYGVSRYDPSTGRHYDTIVSTATSQQQDDHNNPSFTVLPDGKLMILYSKHGSESRFYQRMSLVSLPSSAADWGAEVQRATPAGTTYANTFRLSGESNKIFNFHRCINYNPTLTISSDLGATWGASTHFIKTGTGGTRPYPRYVSNHADRIDLIYTDGHPRDVANSVYHLYYKGGNFCKTDGTVVKGIASLPLDHDAGERGSVIYQYSAAAWSAGQGPDDWIPSARGWTWDIHYGADGSPVVAFQVQRDGAAWSDARIYYYYARWNGSAWEKKFIAQAGRPLYSGETDYGGGMCLDPDDPNVVYISSNAAQPFALSDIANVPLAANARYEIYRGVTSDGGKTFAWEQVTSNSQADNLRPIVPENHGYQRALVWFYGTYTSYTSFSARVLALFENDTDHDGLQDAWEKTNFGDLSQNATGDPDGDGYTNAAEEAAGSNPRAKASLPNETDGDGLPDDWENSSFGGIAGETGAGDPDGDGRANLVEYACGSDPRAIDATPPATLGRSADGTRLAIAFNRISDPALVYNVDACTGMTNWSKIWSSTGASNTAGAVSVEDVADSSAQSSRFLRLRVSR